MVLSEKRFIDACIDGSYDLVKFGLTIHDPMNQELLSLRMACEWGRYSVIYLILEDKRVDPSAYENIALKHCIRENNLNSAHILLTDDRVLAKCIRDNLHKKAKLKVKEKDYNRLIREQPHLLI